MAALNRINPSPWRTWLTWISGIICALVFIGVVCFLIYFYFRTSNSAFQPTLILFNEATKAAFDAKMDQSKNIFQYGIILLGVLWGLVIVKENGIKITSSDRQEVVMFIIANISFIIFVITYYYYSGVLIDAFLYAGKQSGTDRRIPDFLDWEVKTLFWLQIISLASFLLSGVFALFSAHKLKGG